MTGVPARRYYVILIAVIVLGTTSLAAVVGWAWWHDRQLREEGDQQALIADYRGCLQRNELRSVILTILEGAIAQPLPKTATPEQHAYRQLLRSYVTSPELRPVDCPAILERGVK
jgi:hypothetical protein